MEQVQAGRISGVTSVITLMELTVIPRQLNREHVARQYELLLTSFPHLTVFDIDRESARRASQLRAQHRIKPSDAPQVASALEHGAQVFVTNARELVRLAGIIDVIVLEDCIEAGSPPTIP